MYLLLTGYIMYTKPKFCTRPADPSDWFLRKTKWRPTGWPSPSTDENRRKAVYRDRSVNLWDYIFPQQVEFGCGLETCKTG
jgi:hypothetical protein